MSNTKKRFDGFEGRLNLIAVGIVGAMAALVFQLWNLQIVNGQAYFNQARNNWVDFELLKAPRGMILGRDDSVVLADNRAACDLVLTPASLSDPDLLTDKEAVCKELARLVDINADDLLAQIKEKIAHKEPYAQVLVKKDISRSELMRVEEVSFKLPGVFSIARPQRRYYYNGSAGQILGWFNEVSPAELARLKPRYRTGDIIGRSGLEMQYETDLKGNDGAMVISRYNQSVPQLLTDSLGNPKIETDSKGRTLQQLEPRKDPEPGKSIHTTLDMGLQQECERILGTQVGSIVVLNADTGEVLAMASLPSYDPNIFATNSPNRGQLVADTLGNKMKPTLSRGFQFHYPPGSVFKVLLAIAGLEEGVIKENSSFFCNGQYHLPGVDRPWRCWRMKYGGHGSVNVVDALAYSCDVFFYNVGKNLGPEKIDAWANKLGLGVKTGIDLPGEEPGLIPGPEWKRKDALARGKTNAWDSRWYDGETINMSIGQGMVLTTPLQNAVLMSAVLNGGRRVYPFVNLETKPKPSEPLISKNTLRIVQQGLRNCVQKSSPPSGTGKEADVKGLDILGKTGSAQVVNLHSTSHYANDAEIPYELRDHALFVAGDFDRNPRIAVSVIVEHGMHGGAAAAPVARQVFDYFYMHEHGQTPPVNVAKYESQR